MKISHLAAVFLLSIFFSLFALAQADVSERERALELLNKSDYENSVKLLQNFTKQNPQDYLAFYYLGLVLDRQGKFWDAEKAYKTSIALNGKFADSRTMLAYVLLRRDKLGETAAHAEKSVTLDPNKAETHYLLGAVGLRLKKPEVALQHLERAITLNPKFAGAYLLKAHAVLNLQMKNNGDESVYEKYETAAANIEKFIILSADSPNLDFWKGQQESLKFFADYYARKEEEKKNNGRSDQDTTRIQMIRKPRPGYTDAARQRGIQGTVRVLAAFPEDGKVSHVILFNSLGFGLDEEIVKAVEGIEYNPAKRNGKPALSVSTVEYSFTIY